jgi:hypothetical protein
MEHITQRCIDGFFGGPIMERQQGAAQDSYQILPPGTFPRTALKYRVEKKRDPDDNCDNKDQKYNPEQRTLHKGTEIHLTLFSSSRFQS